MHRERKCPAPAELGPGAHGRIGPEAGLTYRFLRRLWRVGAVVLRFHVDVSGLEHLPPTGGWIAAGMPHRTWVDPFLVWGWLPPEPRLVFFGDAVTMGRSPLRRSVVARLGGVIPIPSDHSPGTAAINLAAASRALASGAVFCLFPETGPASPPGRIRRLGAGIAYVALRQRAPIVPIVIGGNDELFIGRRLVVRVQPALDPLDLAGLDAALPTSAPGSSAEREAAHRLLDALAGSVADPVAAAHTEATPRPDARRLGRRLTTLFR